MDKMLNIYQKLHQVQAQTGAITCGKNQDIAKAKGCAETYAIKYFLTKFFLIPTTDELDPDITKPHEHANRLKNGQQETAEQIQQLKGELIMENKALNNFASQMLDSAIQGINQAAATKQKELAKIRRPLMPRNLQTQAQLQAQITKLKQENTHLRTLLRVILDTAHLAINGKEEKETKQPLSPPSCANCGKAIKLETNQA
ncbi:2342_t:CDS:2 [Funneliformis geosporum]|nr:2342_t:CDS:2 [Funneliformis geosporum]